ncbi:50S ribosomal protein L25/general stress protein Ctc [Yinghuangia sp. ASG 101]|uniref:50S ribosomal protein L25/general stress protein Ctc n=1 Tax=Yinghuangia sp. ASG 101 TaxID=2896848 RepID=UPI001E45A73C|nr:50S ribosomal protein L25/general stress protein Ctc [Yinghuangia sp. ASG 101]UGQ14505.1 50S ribosomal protein L25/general stress protein Ctc [Yinghuangia sp. ASG 101]
MSEVRIAAESRSEFGKGAARRARREGKVPAVLYGHGSAPVHLSLPGHDLMLALKTPNVLLALEVDGKKELALPKDVQRHPIKRHLEHVDLILVKRGEKVVVEVPVQPTGTVAPGGLLETVLVALPVEAEATHLPEAVEVSVEGLEAGQSVHAKDIVLPSGTSLAVDGDTVVLHVMVPAAAEAAATDEAAAEAPAETVEA